MLSQQAADDMSTTFDNVMTGLEKFKAYVERIEVRVQAPMRRETRAIAVKTLARMLEFFAAATKLLRKNCAGSCAIETILRSSSGHTNVVSRAIRARDRHQE